MGYFRGALTKELPCLSGSLPIPQSLGVRMIPAGPSRPGPLVWVLVGATVETFVRRPLRVHRDT